MARKEGEWVLQVACSSENYDDNREIASLIGQLAGHLGDTGEIQMNCGRSSYLYANYEADCAIHWFVTSSLENAASLVGEAVRLVNERWLAF